MRLKSTLQILLATAAMAICALTAYAAPGYSFMHIDNSDGLSSNYVKAIARDRMGFVWIGTRNGLNRYDGSGIRHYRCYDESKKRGNDNIGVIYVDRDSSVWVGTDRGVYVLDVHTDSFSYLDRKTASGKQADNWVQSIDGDDKGNVWILLPDQGLYMFNDKGVRIFNFGSEDNLKKNHPSDVMVDHRGDTWVTTTGNGLFRYDRKRGDFVEVALRGCDNGKGIEWCSIDEDRNGNIVFASVDGIVFSYNPDTRICSELPFSQTHHVYLRDIKCFDNEIWIGTQSGLYVIDTSDGTETAMLENPLSKFSMSDDAVYCLASDSIGNAWVGTMFGGVNYYLRERFNFRNYGLADGLSSRLVTGLASDRLGRIWVGTENKGISILDPVTGTVCKAEGYQSKYDIVLSLTSYDGDVYAGFPGCGLQRFADGVAQAGNVFTIGQVGDSDVYSYLRDSRGNEWMGLSYALYRRDAGESEYRRIADASTDWIYTMAEGSDGMVWIGTMGNGIIKYNPANGSYTRYAASDDGEGENGLRSNSISSIYEDSKGNVWFTTDRGGMSRYNKKGNNFTTFDVEDGLPDNTVYSLLEDRGGNLWAGTGKGLVRLNPATGRMRVFTEKDGINGNEYNYKAALKAPDGLFYFGGTHGVVVFDPEKYTESNLKPEIYFTNLKVMGEEVKVGGVGSPLKQSILFTDEIRLPHDNATFSLTVATPMLLASTPELSYRLLPANKEWLPLENGELSFTNLAEGNYTLEVRAVSGNNEHIRRMRVVVSPPWWRTVWAYVFYALLVLGAALAWFLWYRARKEMQLRRRQEEFESEKEREVYRSKVNFFTEIAHEIRTPLSLIDIPLEAMEDIGTANAEMRHYIKVSRQNVGRLLELTGQLLDFEKIDSGRLTLKSENVDIPALLGSIADRFEPAMSIKGMTLDRDFGDNRLTVATDREALTKVVSNLLNNALKYGTHTVRLGFETDGTECRITVASDGQKISGDDREKIFTSFYQTMEAGEQKNGVGLGLPLSRSLAILLGGTLTLAPGERPMNEFVITLPVTDLLADIDPVDPEEISSYMIAEESNQAKHRSDVYTVLLVEDNEGILEFIAEQLRKSYLVETAVNGMEALEKIHGNQPDIIVTDIMMPVMDGMELCRTVKDDINLSHIPVVFITAKNDLDSKVRGLQYGAEGYVEKPFSMKYLKQLIFSILDNRKRQRENFSKTPLFQVDSMQMNKGDEEFMNKVRSIIEENLSEEEFNVERMCDLLCMSRSSLLRKIKTLFNLSPVELIRVIKLKKAAELIADGRYRISDVCFMVGISSPSYFSKLFQKQFGISPKDFDKQCRSTDGGHNQGIN